MEITIRRLGPEDAAAVLASEGVFDHPCRPDQTRAFLSRDDHVLVGAFDGARMVGMASGMVLLHPDKAPAFFVSEVGTAESHRKRGIASRLVALLLETARGLGCEGIWLATEADNAAARALYRRLAARETEGIVVYDWDGAMDG
ncbi:GNAT family N-acetyltransferase [Frigidibacter sp. ROC022]|uniref:GNAT family N-acetyltransferase n=1 Tax=Frigidibacter sp. ROC022 TaxID=2971796 RepID=UPI00215AD04F|nr:GNAT family N-acetyltransferase [Frigidibacter sp. ROC022]MCR8724071.1 GNAT family N-acetyltransferase [Frigidibacter sp. ROC022]